MNFIIFITRVFVEKSLTRSYRGESLRDLPLKCIKFKNDFQIIAF